MSTVPVSRLSLLLPVWFLVAAAAAQASWPSWRGDASGSGIVAETTGLPVEWKKDKNVRWRVALPEAGNSTPAVHGDRVFVTQAVTAEHWRGLMCFDKASGKLLWKNGVRYEKEERTHRDNPHCSASPATDGSLVIASYGSAGLAAYDFEGKQLWHRDFGAIDHIWGNSTSPVLHGDLVIHYHGPAKNAVLYGLDKRTGETVWQWQEPVWEPGERTDGFREKSDEGVIGSFSTPIIVPAEGREELVMSFPMEMKAFDPATGAVLWTCGGLNPLVYTSPIHSDGIVIAMGGYHGNSIGVRTGGNGDVTETHRLWQQIRHNGGIGTGVAKGGYYYYQTPGGVVYCDRMATGETVWRDRLPGAGKSWSSFILSGDRIYSLSQAGDTVVFKATPDGFQALSQCDVGEHTNSSLAVSGKEIFLRTYEALWRIAE